jgi:hypothetical protein
MRDRLARILWLVTPHYDDHIQLSKLLQATSLPGRAEQRSLQGHPPVDGCGHKRGAKGTSGAAI